MIPHQHAGLRYISKASPEAADACSLHNLLVVQPALSAGSSGSQPLLEPLEMHGSDDELAFGLLLECFLGGKDDEVRVRAGFDEDLLSAADVDALVHRLEHVMAQLSSSSSRALPLSRLDMASAHDVAVLEGFNPEIEPVEQCMHWLVEEQARRQPDALAVDAWDAKLTFGQLLDYSDRLAGELQRLGVGPEGHRALCV